MTKQTFTLTGDPRAMGMELAVQGYRVALENTTQVKKERARKEFIDGILLAHGAQVEFLAARLFAEWLDDRDAAKEFIAGYRSHIPLDPKVRDEKIKQALVGLGLAGSVVTDDGTGKLTVMPTSKILALADEIRRQSE